MSQLRGEPIKLLPKVEDIPCIETSDTERLCQHPVVSVQMITYNHEPYIREAVEGIMMQQANFEYELIIGEDASPDNTRAICFELQKKYPDRIRILWSECNVGAGANGLRVGAASRGEFVAFCEGDDYWTDPLKLQKQVNIMRMYPNVSLCFTNGRVLIQKTGELREPKLSKEYPIGIISGRVFSQNEFLFLHTATVLIRTSMWEQVRQMEIFAWSLFLGDMTLFYALALLGDVFFLNEMTEVYRIHSGGITSKNFNEVLRDGVLVQYYIETKQCQHSITLQMRNLRNLFMLRCLIASNRRGKACQKAISEILTNPVLCEFAHGISADILILMARCHLLTEKRFYVIWKFRYGWNGIRHGLFRRIRACLGLRSLFVKQ
ncbi:MAG: glycosyltransferase [Kiritimatiellia bacterium]